MGSLLCGSLLLFYSDRRAGKRSLPPFLNQMAGNFFFPHQRIHLCVKMLLRKVFRSKVDNRLANVDHFPLGGKKLFAEFMREEEPRA